MSSKKVQLDALLPILEARFVKHKQRHPNVEWAQVQARLKAAAPAKLAALAEMERTGGEPDVVAYDGDTGEVVFFDCSAESPRERRSVCYDAEALAARKEHKPANSAIAMAKEMGVEQIGRAHV